MHDSDKKSEFKMVDISAKSPTQRHCTASGKLLAHPDTILKIKSGNLPKGNPLPLAEAAALIAIKNTSNTLPLCHPISIDSASMEFEFGTDFVIATCSATAFAKTGVEMEALNGVQAALLCIYDLTKGVDPALEISEVKLNKKTGGKSGEWIHPKAKQTEVEFSLKNISFTVITLSDRCARGETQDTSGPAIIDFARARGAVFKEAKLIADDATVLKELLFRMCEGSSKIVFTTGGTGVGPRDITPETVSSMGGKIVPGFGELMRQKSSYFTPYAWLSRCEAYVLKNNLVICLPGSKKAVLENLSAIENILSHAMSMIADGNHG